MQKILLIALVLNFFSTTPTLAKDNLINLSDMPITDAMSTDLMIKAIYDRNSTMLDHWLITNKPVISYHDHSGCTRSFKARTPRTDLSNFESLIKNDLTFGLFYLAPCTRLPILDLNQMSAAQHTNTVIKALNLKPSSSQQTTKFVEKYMPIFLDNMEPNQWDQMIWLVLNENLDLPLRLRALDILRAGFDNRENNLTAKQKEVWKYINDFQFNPRVPSAITFHIQDGPEAYIESILLSTMLSQAKKLGGSQRNSLVIPKGFWNKSQELQLDGKPNVRTLELYSNAVIYRELINSKSFEISKQDKYGNTVLHRMFLGNNFNSVMSNKTAANLVRHFIEAGAETRLLNIDGQSPYGLFESQNLKVSNSIGGSFIQEAFLMKVYE